VYRPRKDIRTVGSLNDSFLIHVKITYVGKAQNLEFVSGKFNAVGVGISENYEENWMYIL
jgi:hypothetical protein